MRGDEKGANAPADDNADPNQPTRSSWSIELPPQTCVRNREARQEEYDGDGQRPALRPEVVNAKLAPGLVVHVAEPAIRAEPPPAAHTLRCSAFRRMIGTRTHDGWPSARPRLPVTRKTPRNSGHELPLISSWRNRAAALRIPRPRVQRFNDAGHGPLNNVCISRHAARVDTPRHGAYPPSGE